MLPSTTKITISHTNLATIALWSLILNIVWLHLRESWGVYHKSLVKVLTKDIIDNILVMNTTYKACYLLPILFEDMIPERYVVEVDIEEKSKKICKTGMYFIGKYDGAA